MTNFLLKSFVKNYKEVQDPAVRARYGVLSGGVGIACNLLLFAAKLFAGLLTGAISVTADAFNNLSDAGSSVVTLFGFRMSARPVDKEHPFGHGRLEYLSGLIVSLLIMLVGVELLSSSVQKIFTPEETLFSWLTVGILGGSVLVKLWMCLFNRKLAKTIDSAAMRATAMDSLSDVAATLTVLTALLITHFSGFSLDAYAGVVVALFILWTGFRSAKETGDLLLGKAPDPKLVREVEKTVLDHDEVLGIHDLVIHNYGPGRLMMSLHAEVSGEGDIMQLHDVIDGIEQELREKFHCDAVIHMDPILIHDKKVAEMCQKVVGLAKEIDERITVHDFRMSERPAHCRLIFDMAVPYAVRRSDQEIRAEMTRKVEELDPRFTAVIGIDRS